jgi:hypothetical protein
MLSLIIRSWSHRRARMLLLLLGAVVMSAGLAYLLTLHEAVAMKIDRTVQRLWRSSYDILVRPPDAVANLERRYDILEPNALAAMTGGITIEQWQAVKRLPGVEVAAPIGNVGQIPLGGSIREGDLGPGIYRFTYTWRTDDGTGGSPRKSIQYARVGDIPLVGERHRTWLTLNLHRSLGSMFVFWGAQASIAAIDPTEEAKLVGLDGAITRGRFFLPSDTGSSSRYGEFGAVVSLPLLVCANPYVLQTVTVEAELLEVPGPDPAETVLALGGLDYLKGLTGTPAGRLELSPQARHEATLESLFDRNEKSVAMLVPPPGPVQYRELDATKISGSWPTVVEATPTGASAQADAAGIVWTDIRWRSDTGTGTEGRKPVAPRVLGLFDAAQLTMSRDPENELPMETYRPPTAIQRLDEAGRPVEQPWVVRPTDMVYGVLNSPPIFLTTIDAARALRGDALIGAIRVRARGVGAAGEASQRTLERLAGEITRVTGLRAEITAGASPRPVLVHRPGWEGEADAIPVTPNVAMLIDRPGLQVKMPVRIPGAGYMEMPWVQKGAGIGLLREVRLGRTLLVVAIMLSGALFVFVSTFISAGGWRRETGLLAALGTRPSAILRFVSGESILFGLAVSLTGLVTALITEEPGGLTLSKLVAVAGLPPLLYGLGSLPAVAGLLALTPAAALRSAGAEADVLRFRVGSTVAGLALASLGRRPWRNILSLLGLGLSATLAGVFAFISFRLRGELFLTWMGRSLTLQVGPAHYFTLVLTMVIAAVMTVDLIWLKVQERSSEISLLSSLGVPPRAIHRAVTIEGAALGLAGGVLGGVAATALLSVFYSLVLSRLWVAWLAAVSVPLVCGFLAAQVPAAVALRIPPGQGVRDE